MLSFFVGKGYAAQRRNQVPTWFFITQRETGDRRNGWGHFLRAPGLGRRVPGAGILVQVQELCHLSSVIDSVIVPFRVAGGSPGWQVAGLFHSALHSALNAVLNSVLPLASHRLFPTANR